MKTTIHGIISEALAGKTLVSYEWGEEDEYRPSLPAKIKKVFLERYEGSAYPIIMLDLDGEGNEWSEFWVYENQPFTIE